MAADRTLPRHVSAFRDRHGVIRYRHRMAGQPTRYFTEELGTAEWLVEYRGFEDSAGPSIARRFRPGTLDDLCARYYRSQDFNSQGPVSQAKNRSVIDSFREGRGDRMVAQVTFEHIDAILARAAKKRASADGKREVGGPAAAQRLRKQLRRLFEHAVRLKMIRANPVDLTAQVKYRTSGFHSWTELEIAQFQAHWALGTKPRLILETILWTGQRRGDAYRFGPGHIRGGKIRYEQEKGGKVLWLPLAEQLRTAIDAMPTVGLTTYLVTEGGKPFTKAGFGNWFRDQCDAAGLPHCAAHGLRKAIGRRMAEDGATNKQMKSVGGWTNDREVETYSRDADQQRLAETAISSLSEQHRG